MARGETAVLQCIAGGSPTPRLNWTKDDGPLTVTERHFFAAANQLLIIVDAGLDDAGKYTCIMSNTLGTERGHIYLHVISSPNCDPSQNGVGLEEDGWTTVGIVIIVVVCCIVGTSLVWVIVIYHMRRKSEDYSITHSGGETYRHRFIWCFVFFHAGFDKGMTFVSHAGSRMAGHHVFVINNPIYESVIRMLLLQRFGW